MYLYECIYHTHSINILILIHSNTSINLVKTLIKHSQKSNIETQVAFYVKDSTVEAETVGIALVS